eukprot:1157180-Pelagomonas_calceolata.AAC.6
MARENFGMVPPKVKTRQTYPDLILIYRYISIDASQSKDSKWLGFHGITLTSQSHEFGPFYPAIDFACVT